MLNCGKEFIWDPRVVILAIMAPAWIYVGWQVWTERW
jgi:hypothetical protein